VSKYTLATTDSDELGEGDAMMLDLPGNEPTDEY